jgi:AcrR family transcriptional regulator
MNYLAERRQEEKERRRAEILEAAEAVVASVGWDALTMDQVARRARLSRALLYVYFKDKVDLMYGICERGLATLTQRAAEAVARHRLGLDQIVSVGRAYIAFSQEFPVYFDIMARCELREVNTADAAPNEVACQAAGGAMQARMVAVLETGVRDGSIRPDLGDPKVVAHAVWGMTHGALQLASTKAKVLARHGVDGRAVIEQTMLMATRALAAQA